MIQLESTAITQARVLEFLEDYRKAYEKGGPSLFKLFTRDATVFMASSTARIDSVEELKRFAAFEMGTSRRCHFTALEVRVLGDAALVTCHNRVTSGGAATNLRSSFVLVAKGESIRIAHLHSSLLPLPEAPEGISTIEDITVLEERVATSTAMTGTPK